MYYDLLARIKNAERAGKETVVSRFSGLDFGVANVLAEGGYILEAQKKTLGRKRYIEVRLKKARNRRTINGFKIISRPGRRIYKGFRDLHPVKNGYGLGVVSTPKGAMSDKAARKNKVGGEYLFEIW